MISSHNNNTRAFTLIELLVVISIIALLSSVILASLNSARAKARDARRKQDLRQIYIALHMCYDKKGYVPMTSSYGENNCGGWDYSSETGVGSGGGGTCTVSSGNVFLPFLVDEGMMAQVPLDPLNNGTGDVHYYRGVSGTTSTGYAYAYSCSGNKLWLSAHLESSDNQYIVTNDGWESDWQCGP